MSNCPPPLPSFISHIFSFALQLCCQLCRKQAIRPAGYPKDDRKKNCRSFPTFSTDMRRRTTVRIVDFRSQVDCNPPSLTSNSFPLFHLFCYNSVCRLIFIYKCVCNQLLHFFDEFVKINSNFRSYTNIMILLIQFVFISNEVYYDFLITQGCYAYFQKRLIANLFTFQVC